jgi:predicted ArsR family transcriptional regulator
MQVMGSPQQRHRVLAGISRARLLTVLDRSARPMGVRELAGAVGLHPNTVRQHLDQLVEAGLVVRDTMLPIGRGRPSLRYASKPGSDEQDPVAYGALASVLTEQLELLPDGIGVARTAGERWGRTLAREATGRPTTTNPIGRLVELLDEAGFAPEAPVVDGVPIRLRHCPFGTLARDHGQVVCGVHLGLMRGILRELDAPFGALRLEPFVGPSLCLAYVENAPLRRLGAMPV